MPKIPTSATVTKRVRAIATGSHPAGAKTLCVMEWAAILAGEPQTDHPACVSPVIASFLRQWNDAIPQAATRTRLLRPLIRDVIGTATTDADETRRAWMLADWQLRVSAPAWMALTPSLRPHADALRALPEVTAETGPIFRDAAERAREASDAAWDAAGDTARAAAGAAAGAAAWDAAGDAARAAAGDAAWAAAWDAAWAAAWDAATEHLASTVKTLQTSAQDLVRRLCAVGRPARTGGARE